METTPILTLTRALQTLAEAVEQLGASLPAHERATFERRCAELRRARTELQVWLEEQRG